MDPDSFGDYFLEILNDYESGGESEESRNRINYIKNHTSCLELILQFLPDCPQNTTKLALTFDIITLTLKNRGALLDQDFLEKLIQDLLNFITSRADFIVGSNSVLLFCCNAVAYSYRFLFESTLEESPEFSELFELINDPKISFKKVALSIMKYVVLAMKDFELKHIKEFQQVENISKFQATHLHSYFQLAADIILSGNDNLIDYALDLLDSCFQIYSKKNDYKDLDTYSFNPPLEIIQYYQNPNNTLPQALIQLFEKSNPKSQREKLSIECLMYFASARKEVWTTQAFSRISFIVFTARNITELINNERCQKDDDSLLYTSRLIYKLSMRLPIVSFFQADQQISVDFFVAVRDLTIYSFGHCLMEEPSNYLIKFWSQIVITKFDQGSVPPEFMQLFQEIFDAYIEALGNHDDISIIIALEKMEMSQYIEDAKHLWNIASLNSQDSAAKISEALANSTELLLSNPLDQTSKSILCKIIYLILIISAQFSNRISPMLYSDDEFIEKNVILIDSIYNYINSTGEVMDDIVQSIQELDKESEETPKFMTLYSNAEKALKYLTEKINRDFFVETPSEAVKRILENLRMCEGQNLNERKQFVFDMFFDRFLQDCKTIDEPDLLNELLIFIDSSIFRGSKAVKTLQQNNSLLQSLVQRTFILEFHQYSDEVSIGQLYKRLNQLYVRAIQTVEQFEAFLPYFDHRFEQLQESNYQDADTIYVLYSELHGAFNGNANVMLFLFVFRWFLNNHVDDTINCIENHIGDQEVIESICKAWKSLCSTKGIKLVLPKYSAEGIKLFQSSLKVIEALMNSSLPDSLKKIIIKIIAYSVSPKNVYVNFGVMEYFKDHSFDNMVEIFFVVINEWQVQVSEDKKLKILINLIIQSIIQIKPSLIFDEEKLGLITQFLYRAAYNTVDIKSIMDIFETLANLMDQFVQNDNESGISNFRPHFIEIIDLLINYNEGGICDKVAPALYYILLYDGEYANGVFDLICSLFDQSNRDTINEIFKETFTIDFEQSKDSAIKQLRTNLMRVFTKSIMKYKTNIYDIDEFQQMSEELA